jgi:hypothetical protein
MGELRTSSLRDLITALNEVADSLRTARVGDIDTEELTALVRTEQAIIHELRRRRGPRLSRARPPLSF